MTNAPPAEAAVPTSGLPGDRPAGHQPQGNIWKLTMLSIGIVFGDIGTSPLYAFRETFASEHHPLPVDQLHVFGVISLIFWSMMLVVTLKYVTIITRADNKGEGGSLALLALISRKANIRRSTGIVLLGVFACALFYGDSMITPAISVLSAVEGLTVVEGTLQPFVIPIAIGILVSLFMVQKRGTASVGTLFGPVVAIYLLTLAVLGSISIASDPSVILALNPYYAMNFFALDPWLGFLALGAVVLAVTGSEALYADMGHFGRRAIRNGWLLFVMPALMLNYMGQGALLIADPSAIESPFFMLAPDWFRLPLVFIATCATIIASQAVISGAFSVTQQAMQLGFIPRLYITHTSESAAGQIYIPAINWALLVMVILLVLFFQTSSNLAAAYGVAVTGAMLIDTCLLAVLLFAVWKWKWWYAVPLLAVFFIIDIAYFTANLMKVPDGGWFPLLIGIIIFTLLTTWARGRKLMMDRLDEAALPMPVFIKSAASSATRVPGTAVFLTASAEGVPHSLLHNLKHNKVLHERIFLLTIRFEDFPYVLEERRYSVEDYGSGFYRIILRYGFMEDIDVPAALRNVEGVGPTCRMMDTSFFLSRQTFLPAERPAMPLWREKLFAWMLRNAESAMESFKLPPNRVVELGSQMKI
jgi:KUP system potassium uptake protein